MLPSKIIAKRRERKNAFRSSAAQQHGSWRRLRLNYRPPFVGSSAGHAKVQRVQATTCGNRRRAMTRLSRKSTRSVASLPRLTSSPPWWTTPAILAGSQRRTPSPTFTPWAELAGLRARDPWHAAWRIAPGDRSEILEGGREVCDAAGIPVAGGHSSIRPNRSMVSR